MKRENIIRVVGAFEIFGGIVGAKATIVAMVAGSHGLNSLVPFARQTSRRSAENILQHIGSFNSKP